MSAARNSAAAFDLPSGDVVLDSSSLIPDQVAAGVCVRSAVLALSTGAVQRAAA